MPEDLHVLGDAVVGKLLDVLESDDAAVVAGDRGKARRRLMDIEGADRFEASARPARFKRAGAHIVGACHDRRGQQKRVFERDAAKLRFEDRSVLRHRFVQIRAHLLMQARQKRTDRNLAASHARGFAGRAANDAGIGRRKPQRRGLLVVEPNAAQKRRGIARFANVGTRRVVAQRAADHIGTHDVSFVKHSPVLLFLIGIVFRSGDPSNCFRRGRRIDAAASAHCRKTIQLCDHGTGSPNSVTTRSAAFRYQE